MMRLATSEQPRCERHWQNQLMSSYAGPGGPGGVGFFVPRRLSPGIRPGTMKSLCWACCFTALTVTIIALPIPLSPVFKNDPDIKNEFSLFALYSRCGLDSDCYVKDASVNLNLTQPYRALISSLQTSEETKSCIISADESIDAAFYLNFVKDKCLHSPVAVVYTDTRPNQAGKGSNITSKSSLFNNSLNIKNFKIETDNKFFVQGTNSYNVSRIRGVATFCCPGNLVSPNLNLCCQFFAIVFVSESRILIHPVSRKDPPQSGRTHLTFRPFGFL
jgi:hypothetical protein